MISGIVGGVLGVIFCALLARWVPLVFNGKTRSQLLDENRLSIVLANISFLSGILSGIALYFYNVFQNNDWRGLFIGAGSGVLSAIFFILAITLMRGGNVKEAYVAYAVSQNAPLIVIYSIFAIILSGFFSAIFSLF